MQFEILTLYGRSVQHGAKVEKIDLEEMAFGICCYDRKLTPLLMRCPISKLATKTKKRKKLMDHVETQSTVSNVTDRGQCEVM